MTRFFIINRIHKFFTINPFLLGIPVHLKKVLFKSLGSRRQPWVQLQRRAIRPLLNASQITLSAMLTSSRSQYELGGFPYPLALENNSTGEFIHTLLQRNMFLWSKLRLAIVASLSVIHFLLLIMI